MNRGYVVTPEIGMNDDGTEYVADYSVSTPGHSQPNTEQFYEEDNNGDLVFDEEQFDAELQEYDSEEVEYDPDQEYVDAIHDLFPNAAALLAIAADEYSQEDVEAYNKALDEGDWSVVIPFLEQITKDFGHLATDTKAVEDSYESEESDEEEEEGEDYLDQWTEEEYEILNEEVQPLLMQEADSSHVDHWQDEANNATDPVYQGIAAATAAFHAREVSAQEAINYVLENYPKDEVISIYRSIVGD